MTAKANHSSQANKRFGRSHDFEGSSSHDQVDRPAGLYSKNFSRVFSNMLDKAGVSCYQIHKYTSLDEAYLSRLRNGEKSNPSVETILRIALAMAHYSPKFSVDNAEDLANSVGHTLMPKRSQQYG
jgi:transcriptional regulator with XRE-family HTH domain